MGLGWSIYLELGLLEFFFGNLDLELVVLSFSLVGNFYCFYGKCIRYNFLYCDVGSKEKYFEEGGEKNN